MKTIIDFEYNTKKSEELKKVCYALESVELISGDDSNAPSIGLKFALSRDKVDALFDQLRFQVECANEAGENPYDAVVVQDGDKTLLFSGNVANVIGHLQGTLLHSSHVAAIKGLPNLEKILEKGYHWYVGATGQLEFDRFCSGSDEAVSQYTSAHSLFGFFSRPDTKRSHDEAFSPIEEFDCTIECQ